MSIPGGYSFNSYSEVLNYYGASVHNELTRWPTLVTSRKDYSWIFTYQPTYVHRTNQLIYDTMETLFKDAAPIVAQHWANCEKFVTQARKVIKSPANTNIQILVNGYGEHTQPPKDNPDLVKEANLLSTYRKACKEFRNGMGSLLSPEMDTQHGPIVLSVQAGAYTRKVSAIVERMNFKRAHTLNALSTGAQHHPDVMVALNSEGSHFFLPFPMRKRSTIDRHGKETTKRKLSWGKDGYPYLISTAIASDMSRNDQTSYNALVSKITAIEEIANKNEMEEAVLLLLKEVKGELDEYSNAAMVGGFLNQMDNIDPLFNTYFYLFGICSLEVSTYYHVQGVLYQIGKKIRGKASVNQMLLDYGRSPGIPAVMKELSDRTDIYLPPFVMTHNRLYDVIGVIGNANVWNPNKKTLSPAVSPRYISNFAVVDQYVLGMVAAIDHVEEMAKTDAFENIFDVNTIMQSEFLMHQLLRGKFSNMSNTHDIEDNALSVQVIAETRRVIEG